MGWYGGMMDLPFFGPFLILVSLWSVVWKAFALWQSARSGERWWFLAFMVLNTVGILEILYLFVFTKGSKGVPWKIAMTETKPVASKTVRRSRKK